MSCECLFSRLVPIEMVLSLPTTPTMGFSSGVLILSAWLGGDREVLSSISLEYFKSSLGTLGGDDDTTLDGLGILSRDSSWSFTADESWIALSSGLREPSSDNRIHCCLLKRTRWTIGSRLWDKCANDCNGNKNSS